MGWNRVADAAPSPLTDRAAGPQLTQVHLGVVPQNGL